MKSKSILLTLSLALLLPGCQESGPPLEPSQERVLPAQPAQSRLLRVRVPEEQTPPLYGRMTWSDEWAALFLYRPESCVGYGFDLAEVDLAAIPAVFGCVPVSIEGFFLVEQGAVAPRHAEFHNVGPMPVWLVSRTDFDAARSGDGKITREEMEAASSFLRGIVSRYHITLHPAAVPGLAGGHPVVSMKIQAKGLIDDGRPFRASISIVFPDGHDQPFVGQTSIEIGLDPTA